jgi:hypothetical protein
VEVCRGQSMVCLYQCWRHGVHAVVLSGSLIAQATVWIGIEAL